MPVRMLKVAQKIPMALENRLVNHWGYAIEKRVYHPENYILLKKVTKAPEKANDEGVKRTIRASVNDNVVKLPLVLTDKLEGLSKFQRKELERRCDNIVDFFPDPYAVPESVRARLSIIMQKLSPLEAMYVQHYMDENFPVVTTK